MKQFEPLIGTWHGEGEVPIEPPMRVTSDATLERMGVFIVFRSAGEPEPMHYFDSRGVKRVFMTALDGSTWNIWRAPGEDWNGPDGPGFNQRFIGEISDDGTTIEGRWERGMGDAGDQWELDFPIDYVRT